MTPESTHQLTPLWEVFIRPRNGLHHRHVGSLHAADSALALQSARDVYTRRGEGNSIWVVRSSDIAAPSTRSPMKWGTCDERARCKR